MGALRVLLAVSVLIGHTGPLFGVTLLPPHLAVGAFFVVSGFYMSVVLSGKYRGRRGALVFYASRAARLYPLFIACVALTAATYGYLHAAGLYSAPWFAEWRTLDPAAAVLLAVPNVLIIGSDLPFMIYSVPGHGWDWGLMTPPEDLRAIGATRASRFVLIGPAWSLGVELWYYLVAPVLARLSTRWLAAVAAISFGLWGAMERALPWSSYFFFPALLWLFVAGMLAHRFSLTRLFARTASLGTCRGVSVALFAALCLRQFAPGFRNYDWSVYVPLIAALPYLFAYTRSDRTDRRLGNLSYPVYLSHAAIIALVGGLAGPGRTGLVLAATLAVSGAAVVWLEAPLERRRQRWLERRLDARPPSLLPAGGAGLT